MEVGNDSDDTWEKKSFILKLLTIIGAIPGLALGVIISAPFILIVWAIPFGLLVYIFHITTWISAFISYLIVAAVAIGYTMRVKKNDDGVLLISAGLVYLVLIMVIGFEMSPLYLANLTLPLFIVVIWYRRRDKKKILLNANRNTSQEAPYEVYLKSEHWKTTRARALVNAGYKCQLCNSNKEPLNVHHRTYERLGNELDSDLIVLCEDCHHLFHERRNLGKTSS